MDQTATIGGLRSLDLGLLSSTEPQTCFEFSSALGRLFTEREASGDVAGAAAALLLGRVCYFYFRPDWPGNPWGPMSYGGGSRSITADDLTSNELDALAAFTPNIDSLELQARVADVLWECKCGHQFARLAIEAYRRSADQTEDPIDWLCFVEKLERATDLAASVGRRQSVHVEILDHLQGLVIKYRQKQECGFLPGRLMRILLGHRHGDAVLNSAICEELATSFLSARGWNFAVSYWDLASAWHRKNKNDDEAERCQRELGESMIARGQDEADRTRIGSSYSAGWLLRGIEVLRRSSADPERIDELHKELLGQQRLALAEFHTIEIPGKEMYEDGCKQSGEWMKAHLTGIPFEDAIARFVAAIPLTDTERLRETVSSSSANSLRFSVGVAAVDLEGKTAATVEGAPLSEGPADTQLRAAMFEEASRTGWPLACDFMIEPGRNTILAEHRIRLQDLAFLVQPNAFVPRGHESIYLRGIHAGFHGDFMASSHLLIPQVEQSIRMAIRGHGVNTSTIEGGLQKERDLGWLLTHEKAEEAFGADLLFDLRGILIEKFGENLRNNMCHGLIPAESFYGTSGSCYFWWLTLRLLWIGHQFTVEAEAGT